MSLSTLNSPPLVATAGVGSYLLLPLLEKAVENGALSWSACKAANACAYAVNFVAVSVPGRIDGGRSHQQEDNKKKQKPSKEMEPFSTGRNGRTLVAPSGWCVRRDTCELEAVKLSFITSHTSIMLSLSLLLLERAFTIWAPIFLGELISVSTQLFVPSSAPIVSLLKQLTAPYVVANAFQSLWTAAFRPKYVGVSKFISPGLLGGTAYSLSKAHALIAASTHLSFCQYLLYGFPISLHFGWVTAAALVNFNGAVATFSDAVSAKTVAAVGHVSVIAAATLGAVTITRGAPVYGGVISWALLAMADGMSKRINELIQDDDPKRVGVYRCRLQRRLSQVGALVSGLASLYATVVMYTTKGKTM